MVSIVVVQRGFFLSQSARGADDFFFWQLARSSKLFYVFPVRLRALPLRVTIFKKNNR